MQTSKSKNKVYSKDKAKQKTRLSLISKPLRVSKTELWINKTMELWNKKQDYDLAMAVTMGQKPDLTVRGVIMKG